jgi:hypothetical protein
MLLKKIVDAHGGKLPDDVVVTFSNTGKERAQTLSFVNECAMRWNVAIRWVEYRPVAPFFAEVSHLSADRRGRVFEQMVDKEGYMPNPSARLCTKNLKIKANGRMVKGLGLRKWTAVIGLRADEPVRIARTKAAVALSLADKKHALGFGCVGIAMPLAEAGCSKPEVLAFWKRQPFDLKLRDGDGNCDNCFLLGIDQRIDRIRRDPESANWWMDLEERRGVPFRSSTPSYRQLKRYALDQQHMAFGIDDGLSDCMCSD